MVRRPTPWGPSRSRRGSSRCGSAPRGPDGYFPANREPLAPLLPRTSLLTDGRRESRITARCRPGRPGTVAMDPAPGQRPPTEHAAEDGGLPFPVVGVGASAGGIEALTGLFEGMPAEPGLAFLVVMHLDPQVKS